MKYIIRIGLVTAIFCLGFREIAFNQVGIQKVIAQVLTSGQFRATANCEAKPAIRKPDNPGKIRLSNGRNYEVMGFNSPRREFIQIMVPEANPNLRWVNAQCGTFSADGLNGDDGNAQSGSTATLASFFNNQGDLEGGRKFPPNQPTDITPPPPQLDDFEQAVLKTCGEIGSTVGKVQVEQLLQSFPNVVGEIQQAVGGELTRGRSTPEEFFDDLVGIWTANRGFEHIFCGQIKGRNKIGGLHFVGRYWELQETKRGGRLLNNNNNEEVVEGEIYTLGIVIVDKRGQVIATDTVKGYGYPSSAKNIFVEATQAFKSNLGGACLDSLIDPETQESFQAVFVKSPQGIITFFPDATPSGRACRSLP